MVHVWPKRTFGWNLIWTRHIKWRWRFFQAEGKCNISSCASEFLHGSKIIQKEKSSIQLFLNLGFSSFSEAFNTNVQKQNSPRARKRRSIYHVSDGCVSSNWQSIIPSADEKLCHNHKDLKKEIKIQKSKDNQAQKKLKLNVPYLKYSFTAV